jgi:uncharacterized protein (DUF1697 family)
VATGVNYLALIRGINVGGKNLIKMADLREAFEDMGFADVATYIQSGNVLFRAPRQKREELAAQLESQLSGTFEMDLRVVLLTETQLRRVVEAAPADFGSETLRCDVLFIRKPLTAKRAFAVAETREGVDSSHLGPGVVYFSRLAAKASGSRLSKIVALPEYQDMTIRSWSTTTKLLGVMDARIQEAADRAEGGD